MEFDPDLIIPDRNKSIAEGAVALYRNYVDGYRVHHLAAVADRYGFSLLTPIKDLTGQQYQALMYGSNERLRFSVEARNGDSSWSHTGRWEGLCPRQNGSTARRDPITGAGNSRSSCASSHAQDAAAAGSGEVSP